MPKTLKEADEGGIAQPIQAVLEELQAIKQRLELLEGKKKENGMEEEEEDEVKMEKKRSESSKHVRIYREVDVTSPGRNPVEAPKLGANPVGNVPGEGKYVEQIAYDKDITEIKGRVEKIEEAVGLGREPELAGEEKPFNMMNERKRESLSKRQTIISAPVKQGSVDVRGAVKEFLKNGGVA